MKKYQKLNEKYEKINNELIYLTNIEMPKAWGNKEKVEKILEEIEKIEKILEEIEKEMEKILEEIEKRKN